MGIQARYKQQFATAEMLYKTIGSISCPYFGKKITFNSDGFHHLRYNPSGSEREKEAQLHKFGLLPNASVIIEKSGTVQEYRKQWGVTGRRKANDGSREMKEMQYWGFLAIIGQIRIRVIIRQVGTGDPHFWSIMSDTDLRRKSTYKLAGEYIADQ